MKDFKPQIQNLLSNLQNKRCYLLDKNANAVNATLERYLGGEIELSEDALTESPMYQNVNGVAILDLSGVITKRTGLPKGILSFFGICDLDHIDAALRKVTNDETITACVLNVDSPGGSSNGLIGTSMLLEDLAKTKPTVAFSDNENCSAAYYISCRIPLYVTRDATVGSVSSYMTLWSYSRALIDAGIDVMTFKSGTKKAMFDQTQPLTDEQKTFLQQYVMEDGNKFRSEVTKFRKIAEEDMQGWFWNDSILLEKGFVDGFVTDIQQVIAELQAVNNK